MTAEITSSHGDDRPAGLSNPAKGDTKKSGAGGVGSAIRPLTDGALYGRTRDV